MASKLIHKLFKTRKQAMTQKNNEGTNLHADDQEMVEVREEEHNIAEDVEQVEHPDPNESLNAQIAELKDKYLRLVAEFDNFRKRTARERIELEQVASKEVMLALLPVLDDFERARKIADEEASPEPFSEGIRLVYNKLTQTLKSKGLQAMETDGANFNEEMHEAITELDLGGANTGKIIDTIERGYTINEQIIKYAKVVVGK